MQIGCVSSSAQETLRVLSLYGPFWTSSQHVWLVEEQAYQETDLGTNCIDFFNPALEIMHQGQAHPDSKGGTMDFSSMKECQYGMVRKTEEKECILVWLFLENTLHQIILDYLALAHLPVNFRLMNESRRDLC